MKPNNPKLELEMKPRMYNILSECIESGTEIGYRRAFKHTDSPTEDTIIESTHREIMNKICNYFTFGEDE